MRQTPSGVCCFLFLAWYAVMWYNLCMEVLTMPELSRFEGIIVKVLYNDDVQHHKPHVHVYYGEYNAAVGVDGELLAGSLPVRQLRMVVGWLALHEEEAYAAWNKAVRGEPFEKIQPLR